MSSWICSSCGSSDVRVLNSRSRGAWDGASAPLPAEVQAIYRRRSCKTCGERWNTVEVPVQYLAKAINRSAEVDETRKQAIRILQD